MSPLTLAMAKEDISFRATSLTLEMHFFSMFFPGLVGTGWLVGRAGSHTV